MRKALLLAAVAAASAGCAWHAEQAFGLKSAPNAIWLDDRLEPGLAEDPASLLPLEQRIDRGELPVIRFALNSDVVSYEYYPALDAVADWMLRHPDHKLRMTARTCDLGSDEYNVKLSRRRAKSIKAYLVSKGVPPPSIRFAGLGESKPLAANDTDVHRRENRSVELRFVRRDWNSVY